ncbi:hypothetical protein V7799_02505 [Rhizobium laguerreae]
MKDEIDKAVKTLGVASTNKLYADLGAYSITYPQDPARFANPSVSVPVDVSVAGPMDDAIDLGKRILRRWNKAIYDLVCGTEEADPQVRKTIFDALKLNSPEALAAAITGVLISAFSVGPAVAAIVGVLFGKVLLPTAGQEVCSFWKERI